MLANLFIDSLKTTSTDCTTRYVLLESKFCLCFSLSSSLVVVTQVASLTHADWVVQSFSVLAVPGQLVSSKLSVARRAHVFGIVLSVNMWALRNLHRITLVVLLGNTFRNQLSFNTHWISCFVQLVNEGLSLSCQLFLSSDSWAILGFLWFF